MPATIMCDDAVAPLTEKQHLCVPGVGIQRPAVGKRYDRARSPVFKINRRSIFGGNRVYRGYLHDFES